MQSLPLAPRLPGPPSVRGKELEALPRTRGVRSNGQPLSLLQVLPITTSSNQLYDVVYHWHVTDEKTKAQRGEVRCPRSHSRERFQLVFLSPGSVWPANLCEL